MRSQIGRLSKEHSKSGSGRKELTDRDKWVKLKFGFLGPHIARIKTRSGVNLTERLIAKHGAAGLPTLPKASDDDEYEGHEEDDTRSQAELSEGGGPETAQPRRQETKKRRKCETQAHSQIVKYLQEAIHQSSLLQKQVHTKLAGPQDDRSIERQQWGQWMVSILPGIDDRLWNKFKRDSMDLMERYQTDSADIRRRDQQQVPQPQQGMFTPQSVQQSLHDLSSYCRHGYLPAWQQKYQMPGQESNSSHATAGPTHGRVQAQSLVSANLGAPLLDPVRVHSAPPHTPQASTTTCSTTFVLPTDVLSVEVVPTLHTLDTAQQ